MSNVKTKKIDTRKPDIVLYQTNLEADSPAEPPLLLKTYGDSLIEIAAEDSEIIINTGTIPDLIQALKLLAAK